MKKLVFDYEMKLTFSSPVMRFASSSLTAMRARRATRFTVARSTDMDGLRQEISYPL